MGEGPKSILLCTLGASWAVVPEVFGIVAPGVLDLFRNHPRRRYFVAELERRGIVAPTELWVATTVGTQEQRNSLIQWWLDLPEHRTLRIWVAERAADLSSANECDEMRELIFRLVLHASQSGQHETLVLSLAGGRKTMSADLQWAGSIFGARACLHVIDRSLPEALKKPAPKLFAAPLDPTLADSLEPVFFGPFERSDLVDLHTEDCPALSPQEFPIEGMMLEETAGRLEVRLWRSTEPSLVETWCKRERNRARVYFAHLKALLEQEPRPNWYGLYRLSPGEIDRLRKRTVGPELRTWLATLPKADLHCHLGGVLDIREQREVARAVWDGLSTREREQALNAVRSWYCRAQWPENWRDLLGKGRTRGNTAAGILRSLSEDELARRLYGPTEPRVALGKRMGFRAYELPGDLSGSTLLQSETAVREYARQTYRRLRRDGVRYCELRCSPQKYLHDEKGQGDAQRFLNVFREALRQVEREEPGTEIRLVLVLDRRRDIQPTDIRLVTQARRAYPDLIVGVDIAGDEQTSPRFDELSHLLVPLFQDCLPLTIHAGEGEPADNIWQAVYRLHGERVGHGLTLHQHPELAKRLRDRGIAVELCPTSNLEVVGYYDPEIEVTWNMAEYPLKSYLRELQLDVVLCTDNPGISRTTLADEYLRAARMYRDLTLWQLLSLVRASFEHAFLPADQRSDRLRRYDSEIVERVTELLQGRI